MSKKSFKLFSMLVILIGVLAMGVAMAFLTASDENVNTFVIGDVKIDLDEPNWIPPTEVVQGDVITKDPAVTNTGSNDAFVFMEVSIPKRQIYTYDPETNMRIENSIEGYTPLVQTNATTAPYTNTNTVDSHWVKVAEDKTNELWDKYVYAYGSDSACTRLAADDTTPPVFESISYCYAVEGQGLDKDTFNVRLTSYAIQADDLAATTPGEVWTLMKNQNG